MVDREPTPESFDRLTEHPPEHSEVYDMEQGWKEYLYAGIDG
jgi:hypothetical protein